VLRGATCDAGEDVGQLGLRVDVVEPGGLDQRVEDGGALTTAIGAAEQPCLADQPHAAQRAFGGVVAETDPAVVQEPGERRLAAQHVADRLDEVVVAQELCQLGGEPAVKVIHQWRAMFIVDSKALG
jgi:hypothetical protein